MASVKKKLYPNRFESLMASCPRCVERVRVENFIVNVMAVAPIVYATFACPKCGDQVQISMDLTSKYAARHAIDHPSDHRKEKR